MLFDIQIISTNPDRQQKQSTAVDINVLNPIRAIAYKSVQ